MKRILALFLTLSMMIGLVIPAFQLNVNAAGTTIVVHYQREDGQYDPWNLWIWAAGGDGDVYEFQGEDDFGRVAVIEHPATSDQFGFIVRTDDWDKDIGEDRFIDIEDGKAEIWVTSGITEFDTSVPEGYTAYDGNLVEPSEETAEPIAVEGDVTVRVHYHRYDSNYDGWNIWLWPENGDGYAYQFSGEDEYGPVAETMVTVPDSGRIGVIVRLNEWEAKDIDADRYIDASHVDDNGILDVYLLQGDAGIYYDLDDMDLTPKFIQATLVDMDKIEVTVSIPFTLKDAKNDFALVDSDGNDVAIKHVTAAQVADTVTAGIVILEEPVDPGMKYTISREDYGSMSVDMASVFDQAVFEETMTYSGSDLGTTYDHEATTFRVWAPTAELMSLRLYETGDGDDMIDEILMEAAEGGTYVATVEGDLNGTYYTYAITMDGITKEATDPYAKAVGVNGERAMVIDMMTTNPEGWDADKQLELASPTDAIIYELHVRDLSTAPNSGIDQVGKFLGLTQRGTVNEAGDATGLDHLIELGITHLHLLPSFDYRSIDETNLEANNFNWGYDPENYNTPEGSYSTDPYNGEIRVREFKEMVQVLHENDIHVVMDVVYNHTGASTDSSLNTLVPNYYYRTNNGKFTNGSGCGNETASERLMVRKLIVDSVVYWATEYHIDGFRFDLMGLHDIETMNAVRTALDAIDPSIIIYGEGWTGGTSPLPDSQKSLKVNISEIPGVAAFSDDMRDGVKGSVFNNAEPGFVNGGSGLEESVKFGIVASTQHPQIRYSSVNYSNAAWAAEPTQTVNYVSAHDNLTLYDKLTATNPDATIEELAAMSKLSNAIVLTSQGIPFLHAGVEMLRSKDMDHNSYQSSDEINQIDWSLKTEHADVVAYYEGLIAFRKAHPALRLTTTEAIQENLFFYGDGKIYGDLQMDMDQVVAYIIDNHASGDEAGAIFVGFNAGEEAVTLQIPEGTWEVKINGEYAGNETLGTIEGSEVTIDPGTAMVMVNVETIGLTRDMSIVEEEDTTSDHQVTEDESNTDMTDESTPETKSNTFPILLGLGAVAAGLIGFFSWKKKK